MIFSSITRKPLWQNILAGAGISIAIVAIFLLFLNIITNHGEYLTVPEVTGKDYNKVVDELESKGFEVVIQDSIYVDSIAPNMVIKQFPEPEATVKVNRIIYLTINRLIPPSIAMPNLIGMSLRNALIELRSLGLKLGDTSFVPDIAKNAVKDQLIGGVPIKPGDLVRMGAIIDLQIGAGVVGNELPVPDLFGLNYQEALLVIEVNGLSPGVIILDENLADTSAGFVYWQNPMPVNEQLQQNRIRSGQLIDMKLSASKPEKVSDTLNIPNN